MRIRPSKSLYLSGLQCPKRLYLKIHARELATVFDEGTQLVLRVGTGVGELARGRYPGGVLAGSAYFNEMGFMPGCPRNGKDTDDPMPCRAPDHVE